MTDINKRTYECGCVIEKEGIVWRIVKYCKQHTTNWKKKAEKVIRKNNRKHGKGFTKKMKGYKK